MSARKQVVFPAFSKPRRAASRIAPMFPQQRRPVPPRCCLPPRRFPGPTPPGRREAAASPSGAPERVGADGSRGLLGCDPFHLRALLFKPVADGTLSLKTPLAPRTGGGQDARPAQKSETRLRHPMLGKHLIRPSGFRRQAETGWEAGLAFWKALCAAAGKRQVVRAERTRLLKGETGTGLCNITERE